MIVAVHLGLVWVVGALAPPLAWTAIVAAAFAGGALGLGVGLLGFLAALAGFLMVITATRAASVLGGTGGRRALWALLVAGVGTAGWVLGWAVTDVAGLGVSRDPLLAALLGGVPFALVAGLLLLRGWPFSVGALTLSVALVAAGVVVLRQEPSDELDARLVTAGIYRETSYVVAIPGYLPVGGRDYGDRLGGGSFGPEDPGLVPPDLFITITAYPRDVLGEQMCGQPTAYDSRLTWGACTVEEDGLVYRHNEVAHGYQVPIDDRFVTVVGTPAVDHDLLRAAASSLHPAGADELVGAQVEAGAHYAAQVPGYVGQVTGPSPGVTYTPADRAGNGARSVAITLYVSYAAGEDICFRTTECTPRDAGLTYVRDEDTHGYVIRRGDVNVRVLGGPQVAKELLRQATLTARPATDEELRRILPPPRPHGRLERLRHWLRQF
ncbi:hypothetical protein I6A84_31705 [Frankia sp. CNm7]|uniref:hypothetical protein n=1 Tax=Frankia nepalensis TaxID=1836974 RepID=UPI001E0689B4|nr:hypothetical protein [Frankia nepalensis]MBL7522530.1 hypothetical protein [Frankia nepalensis]